MSKQLKKPDARHLLAREYTARLRKILQGARTPEATTSECKPLKAPSRQQNFPADNATAIPSPRSSATPAPVSSVTQSHARGIRPLLITEHCRRRSRSRIAQLIAKTQRLSQINQTLRAFLPPHLHAHATLTTLDAKSWVVQTDSSAWATRLRYALPNLRQQLGEQLGMTVPALRIRIVPPAIPPSAQPPPRRMVITQATVDRLEKAARDCADNRLGAAILRLAEHARERNAKP